MLLVVVWNCMQRSLPCMLLIMDCNGCVSFYCIRSVSRSRYLVCCELRYSTFMHLHWANGRLVATLFIYWSVGLWLFSSTTCTASPPELDSARLLAQCHCIGYKEALKFVSYRPPIPCSHSMCSITSFFEWHGGSVPGTSFFDTDIVLLAQHRNVTSKGSGPTCNSPVLDFSVWTSTSSL